MMSYVSACDVTVANSNHKNVLFFYVHLCSPTLKIVPPPMRWLPVEQMFRTWMKTLLHCGHGRPQKFFHGEATSTFRLSFFRQTMRCKWSFTKRFLPFLHYKENSPWKHTLRSHCLKSYGGGIVLEFAKRLYFLLSFTGFAELVIIQYHYYCELDKWLWIGLELSTTAFAVLTLDCAGWTQLLKI